MRDAGHSGRNTKDPSSVLSLASGQWLLSDWRSPCQLSGEGELTPRWESHAIKSGRVMKFHLICQEESANVKRHLIKKGEIL